MAKKTIKPSEEQNLEMEQQAKRDELVKRFEAIIANEKQLTERDGNPPVTILRHVYYRGRPIYLRKVGKMFEHMIIHNNLLYCGHMFLEYTDKNTDFTADELIRISRVLLTAAEATIDVLCDKLPANKEQTKEYKQVKELLDVISKAEA